MKQNFLSEWMVSLVLPLHVPMAVMKNNIVYVLRKYITVKSKLSHRSSFKMVLGGPFKEPSFSHDGNAGYNGCMDLFNNILFHMKRLLL